MCSPSGAIRWRDRWAMSTSMRETRSEALHDERHRIVVGVGADRADDAARSEVASDPQRTG
jgi:hypothetical protein